MYDFVVIGAGINGSWTALHLAKRNTNVLLLEQVRNHRIITIFFHTTYVKKARAKISCNSSYISCKYNYLSTNI